MQQKIDDLELLTGNLGSDSISTSIQSPPLAAGATKGDDMAEAKPKSDLVLIREFFGMKLTEVRAECASEGGLNKVEVKLIADGIRSGSLTYSS
jgi:hypothetical protein